MAVAVQTPGNIMYEGKKLGGILTEAKVEMETEVIEWMVIGLGLRIYNQGISEVAYTSLSDLKGCYCNRSELIAHMLNALEGVDFKNTN